MSARLSFSMLILILFVSQANGEECVSLTQPSQCLLEGRVYVRAVDNQRFLVAIDLRDETADTDGEVDHLFLFAQNEPPKNLPTGIVEGGFWIDSGEGVANISPNGHSPISIRFKEQPTSHFWGIGAKGKIEWLENIQPATECSHYEGSCWVANGWKIGFPL